MDISKNQWRSTGGQCGKLAQPKMIFLTYWIDIFSEFVKSELIFLSGIDSCSAEFSILPHLMPERINIYSVEHQWRLESIHTLLLSPSTPFWESEEGCGSTQDIIDSPHCTVVGLSTSTPLTPTGTHSVSGLKSQLWKNLFLSLNWWWKVVYNFLFWNWMSPFRDTC